MSSTVPKRASSLLGSYPVNADTANLRESTGIKSVMPPDYELVPRSKTVAHLPELWRGRWHPLLEHVRASVRWVYICLQDPDPKVMAANYLFVKNEVSLPEGTEEGLDHAGKSRVSS